MLEEVSHDAHAGIHGEEEQIVSKNLHDVAGEETNEHHHISQRREGRDDILEDKHVWHCPQAETLLLCIEE